MCIDRNLYPEISAEDVAKLVPKGGEIYQRDCSMCGYPLKYIIKSIEPEIVWFDSGCDCTSYPYSLNHSSLADIANTVNMQKKPEHYTSCLNKIKGPPE